MKEIEEKQCIVWGKDGGLWGGGVPLEAKTLIHCDLE